MASRKKHIPRPALPWRGPVLTECGRSLVEGQQVTKAEMVAAFKEVTIPRTATWNERLAVQQAVLDKVGACQVCWEKARSSREWDRDPVAVVRREADLGENWGGRTTVPTRLTMELRAITDLIAAHRGEFDGLLEGYKVFAALTAPPSRITTKMTGR